jgi:hypothetical protein
MRTGPLAIATAAVLSAATAQAQRPDCARAEEEQVRAALELRRRGDDEGALAILEAQWARCPSPRVRAQVALAEQGLRRWSAAWTHLREAIARADDPWIASRAEALRTAMPLIEEHLPALDPRANADDAELLVDGRSVGRLPLPSPRRVPAGTVVLEIRAPGRVPLRRTLTLRDDEVLLDRFALEPASVSAPPTPRCALPPPLRAPEPTASPRRAAGWALVAGGAAVVVAGAAVWVGLRLDQNSARDATALSVEPWASWSRYNDIANANRTQSSPEVCARAESDGAADAARVREICASNAAQQGLALGLGVGGLALAIAGVALVATAPGATAPRVAASLGPGGAGAAVTVPF